MRVAQIVRLLCKPCLDQIHARRLTAVMAVITAITKKNRLSLTSIGRSLESKTFPKHDIKRVDRLLSNPLMWIDRHRLFAAMASTILGTNQRPTVLLDWTKCGALYALVAAVPVGGRAIPIYLEVHPEKLLGNSRIQRRFLNALRRILPEGVRPILVTDAGFQGPFFLDVQRLGWDFVGRLRGTGQVLTKYGWIDLAGFYLRARFSPMSFGFCRLYRTVNSVEAHVVLARIPSKGRHPWTHRRTGFGGVPPSTITGSIHPWLLVSSLAESPEKIISLYAKRMQIEETFRDAKNHRYGWSLRHVRCGSPERLQVLLLLASIAMAAVSLLGAAATAAGRHRRYQANTVRSRVLSDFVLGVAINGRRDITGLSPFIHLALSRWRLILLEQSATFAGIT
jgi:hypothetical protein